MINTTNENTNPNGNAPQSGGTPTDRSASALQYQHYQLDTMAKGINGVGFRVAPDPNSLFSNPPVSKSQFGGGSNAREPMT